MFILYLRIYVFTPFIYLHFYSDNFIAGFSVASLPRFFLLFLIAWLVFLCLSVRVSLLRPGTPPFYILILLQYGAACIVTSCTVAVTKARAAGRTFPIDLFLFPQYRVSTVAPSWSLFLRPLPLLSPASPQTITTSRRPNSLTFPSLFLFSSLFSLFSSHSPAALIIDTSTDVYFQGQCNATVPFHPPPFLILRPFPSIFDFEPPSRSTLFVAVPLFLLFLGSQSPLFFRSISLPISFSLWRVSRLSYSSCLLSPRSSS